jgi:hypothetical protein
MRRMMLEAWMVASLLQAGAAKPGVSPRVETSQAAVPAQIVTLPPEAAALVAKASIAGEMVRLCQTQLAAARERSLAVANRQTELKNQHADLVRERETADATVARLLRGPQTEEVRSARSQATAARTKLQNIEAQVRDLADDVTKLNAEIGAQSGCIERGHHTLRTLLAPPSPRR